VQRLTRDFYERDDVVSVSRDLLGKVLCSRIDGELCRAVITETEAYAGETDRASHAFGGRRTPRTEPMFARGGRAYVYLCYGIHHLFNVVTGRAGVPHAVLVRGGRPLAGEAIMRERRGGMHGARALMDGPGKLAQALGITTAMTGETFAGRRIWIEDHGFNVAAGEIEVGPRVGVDYAGPDAARPYRFLVSQDSATAGFAKRADRT